MSKSIKFKFKSSRHCQLKPNKICRNMLDEAKNPGGLCDIYTEEALAAAAKDERRTVSATADPVEGFVRTLEGINRLRKAHRPATNKESRER